MHRGFAQAIQNNHGFYLWLNDDVILTSTTVQILLNCYARNHHKDDIGAASVWVVLNAGYVLIGIRFMYARLLKGEMFHWYYHDVAKPLLSTLIINIFAQLFMRHNNLSVNLFTLSFVTILSFLAAAMAIDIGRKIVNSISM